MERDPDACEIPNESVAGTDGRGRGGGARSQAERDAAEARANGKRRRDPEEDSDEFNSEPDNVLAHKSSALRMACMLDGTMSAEDYAVPPEIRSLQGALHAEGAPERAGASDNWAQAGLTASELRYNERCAIRRAKARMAYEEADNFMTTRAEERGAEPSEELEHLWWADVSAPMLFDSSEAHRNEMEDITLADLHACCAHRLSVTSGIRREGCLAPLYVCITENQDLIKGFKVGLASFSQCRDFLAHDGGMMQVSSAEHADTPSMQVSYRVTRCRGPSPFELHLYKKESKEATVATRRMFFCSGSGCLLVQ